MCQCPYHEGDFARIKNVNAGDGFVTKVEVVSTPTGDEFVIMLDTGHAFHRPYEPPCNREGRPLYGRDEGWSPVILP